MPFAIYMYIYNIYISVFLFVGPTNKSTAHKTRARKRERNDDVPFKSCTELFADAN